MLIRKIRFAYFTPVQLTRRVMYCVISGMNNGIASEQYNLTAVAERQRQLHFTSDELLVVALPCYGGRLPQVAPPLLENLHGDNTPAVVIATYGGRAYEDTLVEMQEILHRQGFVTVAGAAFVTAHAMSPEKVGAGRPNADDIRMAKEFGQRVREKLEAANALPEPVQLPGSIPFKPLPPKAGFSPLTNDKCVLCMQCFRWCPTDAIKYNDPNVTDANRCVLCHGCVIRCPVQARQVMNEGFHQRVAGLEANFGSSMPENEMFI